MNTNEEFFEVENASAKGLYTYCLGLPSKDQWSGAVLQKSAHFTPFYSEVEMEDSISNIYDQEFELPRVHGCKNSKLERDFQALSLETGHPSERPSYRLQNTLEGLKCKLIWSVKFSPSGKSIAGAGEGRINVWDEAGKLEHELVSNKNGIGLSEIDWSKDGSLLLGAGCYLKLWNVNTGKCVGKFRGHNSHYVSSAKFSPDGRFILSGSDDCTAILWDANTGVCLKTFMNYETVIRGVDFNHDGTHFMITSCTGECYMYDLRSLDIIENFTNDEDPIYTAKFSPDYRYILFSMRDYSIRLYDMRKQKVVGIYKRPRNTASASNFSLTTSGKYIVAGSSGNLIYIWDVNTQEIVQSLEGHSDTVECVACHPDNDIIVSGSRDNSIKFWKSS